MKINVLIACGVLLGAMGCRFEDRGPDVVTTPSAPPVVIERDRPNVTVIPPARTETRTETRTEVRGTDPPVTTTTTTTGGN